MQRACILGVVTERCRSILLSSAATQHFSLFIFLFWRTPRRYVFGDTEEGIDVDITTQLEEERYLLLLISLAVDSTL